MFLSSRQQNSLIVEKLEFFRTIAQITRKLTECFFWRLRYHTTLHVHSKFLYRYSFLVIPQQSTPSINKIESLRLCEIVFLVDSQTAEERIH